MNLLYLSVSFLSLLLFDFFLFTNVYYYLLVFRHVFVCLFVSVICEWVKKKIHFIHSLSDDYNDGFFFCELFKRLHHNQSFFFMKERKSFEIKVGGDMRPYFFFVEVDLKIDQSSSIWWWYLILITNNKLLTNDRIIFFPREKWPEYYCLWLVADNFFQVKNLLYFFQKKFVITLSF